ncbi:hypothetical protein HH310_05675 [Actinoplanes sp. TBRC 11911]|uniref:DUF6881 domain-containing protein n=1 Tax=Actinoplanes sp. TBRC 11911 TaxID=2729386 RepID=UPI00145ED3C6|nr:hypothetical protein [Actinoplanes sp. TBRC 11911]NMO50684.1 hypothetical protein [Actinoplanes sp. TBRC 11911]
MSDAEEMRYWKVRWLHDFPDEPVELYSEIGEDDFEQRKVEVYRDGHRDYASASTTTGTTMLSDIPVGTFDDIAAQADFEPRRISADDFERIWRAATEA